MNHDLPKTVRDLIAFYETLTHDSLGQLGELYAPDARFKDPFNDVRGLAGIRQVFTHMFATVQAPRFKVLGAVAQGDQAWLHWDFTFQRKGAVLTIHGATRLVLDGHGRVALHRDYWDPAQELYAKLPWLGAVVRWLTRRLSASGSGIGTSPHAH